ASILWFASRFEMSRTMAEKAIELNPAYSRAYEDLGRACEQLGELDRAIEAFQRAITLDPYMHGTYGSLSFTYAIAGKQDETFAILERLKAMAETRFVSAFAFALIHIALGNTDEAFDWLGKAVDERSGFAPGLDVNPRLASIRADPRFAALRRKVGLT